MEKVTAQWKGSSIDLGNNMLKRTVDCIGSLVLIIIFSPILAIIALLIRRDGGSSIYKQERIGYGGKTFKCYKFRSMVMNSKQRLEEVLAADPKAREEWENDFKLKNDPRITAIGNFLRKTSLDELPQLFNVLQGDMSLVGPRPVVPDELPRYGALTQKYLSARPGMTGLWQVSGRNDVTYRERVSLDCYYIENWKLHTDFVLMLKTVTVIFHGKGAY
ncbi:sugar transferase [Leucothrix mucor]|uniref:sugar transferase n=1 Tax=Leucothrix mucor TaxID=45248 RepID=UPI0003B5E247|nr:sugar transferase [Leucothrix mucor]